MKFPTTLKCWLEVYVQACLDVDYYFDQGDYLLHARALDLANYIKQRILKKYD